MRRTVLEHMKRGDFKAVHGAILNDGTKGRGGEILSSRREKEAALLAKGGLKPPSPTVTTAAFSILMLGLLRLLV